MNIHIAFVVIERYKGIFCMVRLQRRGIIFKNPIAKKKKIGYNETVNVFFMKHKNLTKRGIWHEKDTYETHDVIVKFIGCFCTDECKR